MASLDVTALFPSIPHEKILTTIKNILQQDELTLWKNNRHNFSLETILKLLEIVTKYNFVSFEGDRYLQIKGVPMGSPVSVSVANLVMFSLESAALATFPRDCLATYMRYVDDIFIVLKNTTPLEEIVNKFNTMDPNIQFTVEWENEGTLPFLDVQVTRVSGEVQTSVYHKPTAVDRCLHFRSNHPRNIFRGILKGAFTRARRICKTNKAYNLEADRLFRMHLRFGYPLRWIKAAKRAVDNPADTGTKPIFTKTISIPYTKAFEPLKRIYAQKEIRLTARPTNTIGRRVYNLGTKGKSKWDLNLVVYKYACNCGKFYIGQTKRSLKTRMAEHKRSITNGNKAASELADHIIASGHVFDSNNFSIIDQGATSYRTWIREGYHIQQAGNEALNRKEIRITETWIA